MKYSNSRSRGLGARTAVAAFAISVLVGAITGGAWLGTKDAHATACPQAQQRYYVAQFSTAAAYGIDGYAEYVSGGLLHPDCDKIAQFLNVMPNNSQSGPWIQVGVRIGALDASGSNYNASTVVYVENFPVPSCTTSYQRQTFGSPTSTNAPYYLFYDGSGPHSLTYCGSPGTYYEYAAQRDFFGNFPLMYAFLPTSSPQWSAQVEVGSMTSPYYWEWNGNRDFGNPSTDLGHGMAWYNQPASTWNEWSTSTGASISPAPPTPPLRYCDQVHYRAFRAVWSVC